MSKAVVQFRNVTKAFRGWHERPYTIKSLIADLIRFRWNFQRAEHVLLENISLEIYSGEFVGIMGRNGIGKSTLLKLISGIYSPTKGEIITCGRLIPLLELGAGFASDLSGYENIFLNGSILGFSRKRVLERLDEIIEFSGLGPDVHRPVRNYSSGMLVRLGFSIAAHLDAELLLFDEVLTVGDMGFQEKCLRKIVELHRQGSTIILVSHDSRQIENFCKRCIVLDGKQVIYDGVPSRGVESYEKLFRPHEQNVVQL